MYEPQKQTNFKLLFSRYRSILPLLRNSKQSEINFEELSQLYMERIKKKV